MDYRTNRLHCYLFAAILLFCAVFAHSSTTTLTGTIVDEQGNPLNGTLTMRLPFPAQDQTTNVAVTPTLVSFNLVNGAIVGGVPLFDVANLQPQGLYYIARAYDTTGALQFYGNYVVTGATFNLGAATPTSVQTSNVSYVLPIFPNQTNIFTAPQQFVTILSNTGSDAANGFIRMANSDLICWRNVTNTGDDCIGDTLVGSSDFTYFSAPGGIVVNSGVVEGAAGNPALLQSVAAASAAGPNVGVTAASATGTNTNGGNVVLTPGAKNGSGSNGSVQVFHAICTGPSTACQVTGPSNGCFIGGTPGNTCTQTLAWPNSFDDTNYVTFCQLTSSATGAAVITSSFASSASHVTYYAVNLFGSSTVPIGTVSCLGIHY
jgi:hypothetical protein